MLIQYQINIGEREEIFILIVKRTKLQKFCLKRNAMVMRIWLLKKQLLIFLEKWHSFQKRAMLPFMENLPARKIYKKNISRGIMENIEKKLICNVPKEDADKAVSQLRTEGYSDLEVGEARYKGGPLKGEKIINSERYVGVYGKRIARR